MTEIKVGQVWGDNTLGKVVITHKEPFGKDYLYDYIFPNGVTDQDPAILFIKNYRLIAEFPTWQEAVNSEEFKEW